MALTAVGVNHRRASVEIREKLAYAPGEMLPAVEAVRESSGASEGILLSTCNRTELYLVETDGDAAAVAWDEFSTRLGTDCAVYGYVHRDIEAAAHLFRVASGLDS